MKQIIRELKRQAAGEKLEPEQLKGLIRAGYVYRNGDEHLLTDMGRDALAQPWPKRRDVEIAAAIGARPIPLPLQTTAGSSAAAHYLLPLRPFVEARNDRSCPSLCWRYGSARIALSRS
jgi:hypothetical protein